MAERETTEFVHKPLQRPNEEIRLLRFLAVEDDAQISLEISTWKLSEAPVYSAISYTWGDPRSITTVSINDGLFYVRENCHYALWQVRHHYPDDYVWIDSICINQEDAEEKNAQVRRIWDIFSTAAHVLACVGPAENESGWVFRLLESDELDPEYYLWPMPFRDRFLAFMRRPYWERLWIIQELAASRGDADVLCGLDRLPFSIIQVYDSDWNYTLSVHCLPLSEIFTRYSEFACADPLDHLYGLLPLIKWPEDLAAPEVDYRVSGFDLALRLISHVDIVAMEAMLRAFAVCDSKELGALIFSRQVTQSLPFDEPTPVRAEHYPPHHFVSYGVRAIRITVVGMDKSGSLAANEAKNLLSNTEQFSDYAMERLYASLMDGEPALKSVFTGRMPRAVIRHGETVALVCSECEPGDVLVELRDLSKFNTLNVVLVLRHNFDNFYDLVGQGILLKWNGMSWYNGSLDEDMRIALKAEDWLVLIGQGKQEDSSTVDPVAHFTRLITTPTLEPRCAVRLELKPGWEKELVRYVPQPKWSIGG